MAGKRDPLKDTIDRLYGLPLDEFTPARDAAAKERRGERDRDSAETIKRLRKPNLVAWSLNRVRRAEPGAVEELLAAGERLQTAQRQLVSGGERGLLRDAAADERALVGRVVDLAAAELEAAGHAPNADTRSKLFATLHAAAASADVRALLAEGRLISDHELSDLGLGGEGALLVAAPTSERKRSPGSAPTAAQMSPRKTRALADRLERARVRHAEQTERADQARHHAEEAERTAREAADELRRAESAARKATAAAEKASAAAGKASEFERRAADAVAELEADLAALAKQC